MTAQSAFFCAGQAIGLREIGAPVDVALRDAPKMKPKAAAATLLRGASLTGLPIVEGAEPDLFSWCCALATAQLAAERGATLIDKQCSIATARLIRAVADVDKWDTKEAVTVTERGAPIRH